jgi:hypothetical protein
MRGSRPVRRWLLTHKSLVISVTGGVVIAALIIVAAVVSTGYAAQKVTLDDGSVWVANGTSQVIGRANPQVLELNSVVASSGSQIDVVQQGSTVLLFDRSNAKVDIVDPATSTVLDSVPLPPQDPELFLAGDNVVIGSGGTGQFWIVSLADLSHFDAQSAPTLSLGADAVASVTPDGMLFAFSATAHEVYRVDAAQSDAVAQTWQARFATAKTGVTITSVGGQWVLLDASSRTLLTSSGTVSLSGRIPADASPVLQQASSGGDGVLIGYSGGVLDVPLGGGTPGVLEDGQSGVAVAPIVLGDCSYAAWSDGTAWRHCDGSAATTLHLESVQSGDGRLSFMANGDTVVLNDPRSGGTWAVQQDGQYIDNWSDLITVRQDQQQVEDNSEDTPPQYEKEQVPPVAVDDSFGARPGRTSLMPVLLNDYDANGDALVISSFTPIDSTVGHLDLINEGQELQLTLADTASGSLSFGYTITDGRGGSASATVTVAVRLPSQNSPPVQVRQTKTLVAQGGKVTASVLADWVDPDGDPVYLAGASTTAPDTVSYKPEGTVVFSEGGATSTLRSVALVVSDGRAQGTGSLDVTVRAPGQVPIIADPFVVQAYAGQEVTVSPLDHVRGGTGALRLAAVPAKTDATIAASLEAGTFTFSSTVTGTHYLDYVVNDGDQTADGEVRVDVVAPPDANTKPITIPKTVFVPTLSSQTIDVADTDIDPAGGVLLVTGVSNIPQNSGVRADVIADSSIRVTLGAPLDNGPVVFDYHETNGLATAEGVVTVVQIPPPAQLQPPVANNDSVTVREGDAIDIPVLANDVQPDGEALTLDPLLSTGLKSGSGLLFASGDVLRYLAPDHTGDFTAVYQVSGPDGQTAQAQVTIAVREADAATNNPPVPQTVTGRVFAGSTVRIAIPLTGIDPDGDSVQLLGQTTAPEKGTVTATGSDYMDYQAGDYSAGTDTFTYTVVDALGARATGIVRVGISPKIGGARNPVAVEDDVTMRPGGTVSVQVLANDSDPDGGRLKVVKVEPNSKDIKATIDGDIVKVTPPKAPATYGLVYTVENEFGGRSSNFIRVVVDPNAPRAYPQVSDTVLTLTDILGRSSLNVNVLHNVFFADGPPSALKVSLLPGYDSGASVKADKRIAVRIEAKNQIIPFAVANPDDPQIVSYGFIHVPGLDDALPQINLKAPPLTVASEAELRIDLDDYVLAVGGKKVQLTDTTKVQATHANGDSLVVNDHTLRFTSANTYFGPASISFEVTDGSSPTDPNGHVATLVLPITVTPRQNQPPTFVGGVIDFEPGSSRQIDLTKLTDYPHPKDIDELAYTVLSSPPTGFSYTLTGQSLVLTADADAQKGTSTAILLGVKDALSTGQSGRIQLNVVASSRPLASPAPDSVSVQRGQTQTVDVLANDAATNPFPGEPLRVIAIRGIDGDSLPDGVSVTPSADNSRLTVSVSATATPGATSLQYEVADATNDPDRYVWGTVTISVQDKPDPVTGLTATGFADRSITLHWSPGSDNNSPITGYDVMMYDSGSPATLLSTTPCDVSVCTVTTPGNGPSNAVRIRVVANNALGSSTPVGLGSAIWSDLIPSAPNGLSASPLDGGLHITWDAVSTPSGGSPVSDYAVMAGGIPADVSPASCSSTCSIDITGLSNGQAVTVTVTPKNGAYAALTTWNSASTSGIPAGDPVQVGTPSATATDSSVTADWTGDFDPNGRDISGYTAILYTGSAPTCTDRSPSGSTSTPTGLTTSTSFSASSGSTYSIVILAENSQGCTASSPVATHTAPGVVSAATFDVPNSGGPTYDAEIAGATIDGNAATSDYTFYYQIDGVEYGPVAIGAPLVGNGALYGVAGIQIALRACLNGACQPTYSGQFGIGATPVNPQVSGVQFTPAAPLSLSGGTFTWLSWPAGGYDAIQYNCGNGFVTADTSVQSGSCSVPLLGADTLTIRVTANGGTTYDVSYDENGTIQ